MILGEALPEGACVQIVPNYPPEICGVGDYAAGLSDALRGFGVNMQTVFATPRSVPPPERGQTVIGADSAQLASALDPAATVLLHFSGYGYERHGLCDWLVDALQVWRSQPGRRHLVSIFHEVFATGPIWRRSFWTAGGQKQVAGRLARLSDACFVSSYGGAHQLRQVAPSVATEVIPVFSNVGEVTDPLALRKRDPVGVVFGTIGPRQKVFAALRHSGVTGLETLKALGVRAVVDIGAGDAAGNLPLGLEIRRLGRLPATEVASVLASSRVGLIDYPDHVICKSGILAAYLAHGVLAVNTQHFRPHRDKALHGIAYIGLENGVSQAQQQWVATTGHEWYRGHSISQTASIISQQLVDRRGA